MHVLPRLGNSVAQSAVRQTYAAQQVKTVRYCLFRYDFREHESNTNYGGSTSEPWAVQEQVLIDFVATWELATRIIL